MSAMLTDDFDDTDTGIGIKWSFDGSVFNLRLLQTKVQSDTINDFLFADDSALNATHDNPGWNRSSTPPRVS
jgi:hypothetical protein